MRTYERNKGRGVVEVIEVGDDLVELIEDARDAEWQRRLAPLHEGFDGDGCDSGDPIDWSLSALEQARAAPDNTMFDLLGEVLDWHRSIQELMPDDLFKRIRAARGDA